MSSRWLGGLCFELWSHQEHCAHKVSRISKITHRLQTKKMATRQMLHCLYNMNVVNPSEA